MRQVGRVGISRCLLGDAVRYDGRDKFEPTVVTALAPHVEWVPMCPEVEVGMGVPREPVFLTRDGEGAIRMLGLTTGTDWTMRMHEWARARLTAADVLGLDGFVLKARSPSCGPRDVPIRGGEPGAGVFANVLRTMLPDVPCEDEEQLRDETIRGEFLKRVRAHATAKARRR